MRVLVVDDSKAMRLIIMRTLRHLGFTNLAEASQGKEGLEKLKEGPFDLVLSDWNMPEMDGLTFVQEVRKNPSYAAMKIMMVTTESESGRVTSAMEAGANEYVMKPFTEEALQQKLKILGLV